MSAVERSQDEACGAVLALRPAGPNDRGFVVSLAFESFARLGDYDRILGGWFDHADVVTSIATVDGSPVGYVLWAFVAPTDDAPLRPVADIVGLGVSAEWRRAGIGRALLDRALLQARTAAASVRAERAALSVAEDNVAARTFFERAGFVPKPSEDTRYPRGQRCLRLVKPL